MEFKRFCCNLRQYWLNDQTFRTKTMTHNERKLPFSGILIALISMLWCVTTQAQNWQESYVLNENNSLSWEYSVGHFPHTFIVSPDPSIGAASMELTGGQLMIDFVPVEGALGTAEFIIEYWPEAFPPHPTQIAFRVFVVNSYIDAQKDYASVEVNSTDNVILPLDNDVAIGGGALEIAHLPIVRNGAATISADHQTVVFTPETDFAGMAYMSYVVCDDEGACERTEINICVLPPGPLAASDTIYLSTDSRSPIGVFLPAEGFAIDQAPTNGTIVQQSNDAWQYNPASSFAGVDEFSFAKDTSLHRTVMVDVYYQPKPNNFANDDVVYTHENASVSFDVVANDVKTYPLQSYTQPEFGTLTNDSTSYFTYVPAPNYHGAVTFTYTTCFFPNCETAEVVIYVGDMVPENTVTYDLTTQQDVPLVLNYEIPLDGYAFSINAHPASGALDLYSGESTVQVLCSSVTGFDLLVYEPGPGFIGDDAFEIYYCVDNGDCHLVKIDVSVEPLATAMPCPCVDRCVWPGDVDQSGEVNMGDLLALGWHLGDVGIPRAYPDNTMWMGQYADDWNALQVAAETDVKYADSDGDGVIALEDAQSIMDHYLRRHTLVPEPNGLKADYPFNIVPMSGDLDSGDLAVLAIVIGDEVNPVMDMHGVQFSLNLPPELVDLSTVNVDFEQNCWLAHDAPTIELQVQPWDGRVDAGMTRVTGSPATGAGMISTMTFIVVDDIEGFRPPGLKLPLTIGVNSVSGVNHSGRTMFLDGTGATIYLGGNTPQKAAPIDDKLFIYPNPASGEQLNIHLNGQRSISEIQIFSMTGQLMASHSDIEDKHFDLPIASLNDGMYVARVVATDGVVSKRFEVIRSH